MQHYLQGHKLEQLPFELINERNASENERLYYQPSPTGKRYAILMMILFFIIPAFFERYAPYYIWLGAYAAILLGGFGIWYWTHHLANKPIKILNLRGKFTKFLSVDGKCFLLVTLAEKKPDMAFRLPQTWAHKHDFPLNYEVSFEVCSETGYLVSIDELYSLESDLVSDSKIKNIHYVWIFITLVFLMVNMNLYTNHTHGKLALKMLMQPGMKMINRIDDWKSVTHVGQRVQAFAMYKQCQVPTHTGHDDRERQNRFQHMCSEFNVVDKSSTIDFMAIAAPTLKKLTTVHTKLSFPSLTVKDYQRVMYANQFYYSSVNRPKLTPRKELVAFNTYTLDHWVRWIEENKINAPELKNQIVELWLTVARSRCRKNCWPKLLAKQKKSKNGYLNKNRLARFNAVESDYFALEIKKLMNEWRNAVVKDQRAIVHIRLSRVGIKADYWDTLFKSTRVYYGNYKTGAEYLELIKDVAGEINSWERGSIGYGVVSAIEGAGDQRTLVIDTSMSDALYKTILAKIFIALIGGGLLVILITFLIRKSKQSDGSLL